MNIKKILIRGIEAVLLRIDDWVANGLAWCDRHWPVDDIDELIAEIDDAHRRLIANQPSVRIPRVPQHRERRH